MDDRGQPRWERVLVLLTILLSLFVAAYVLSPGPWREPPRQDAARSPIVPASAAASAPAARRLAFPLAGFEHALRDNFDDRRGTRRHKALDIMAPRGTPVRAVDDGTIAKLYRGPLAGIAIYQLDSARTRVYFYAHLARYAPGLEEGQPVERGQVIGYVGSTGNAPERAPHLHFAMHELGADKRWGSGKAVNPYGLLAPPAAGREGVLTASGSTP